MAQEQCQHQWRDSRKLYDARNHNRRHGFKFDVVVSNSVGNITSTQATLTVNSAPAAPTITTQPANQNSHRGPDRNV